MSCNAQAASLMHMCDLAPVFLQLHLAPSWPIRSVNASHFFQLRAFAHAITMVWNYVPLPVCLVSTYSSFSSWFRCHFFREAFPEPPPQPMSLFVHSLSKLYFIALSSLHDLVCDIFMPTVCLQRPAKPYCVLKMALFFCCLFSQACTG